MKKNTLFILMSLNVCLITVSACSHRPPKQPPPMHEQFHTNITKHNLKIFTYTVSMSRPGGSVDEPPGNRRRSFIGNGGKGLRPLIEQKLQNQLTETGYCREGYIELGSSMGRGESFIRGECREGATLKDKDLFPNKKP